MNKLINTGSGTIPSLCMFHLILQMGMVCFTRTTIGGRVKLVWTSLILMERQHDMIANCYVVGVVDPGRSW